MPRALWSSWAAWRASSGRRSGPSTMTATRAITASSSSPTSNMPRTYRSEPAGGGESELHAGQAATAAGQRLGHPGQLTRRRSGRVGLHDRLADVAALTQRDVERDAGQDRHVVAEALGQGARD